MSDPIQNHLEHRGSVYALHHACCRSTLSTTTTLHTLAPGWASHPSQLHLRCSCERSPPYSHFPPTHPPTELTLLIIPGAPQACIHTSVADSTCFKKVVCKCGASVCKCMHAGQDTTVIGEQEVAADERMLLVHKRGSSTEEWMSVDEVSAEFITDVLVEYSSKYEERQLRCFVVPSSAGGANEQQHAACVTRDLAAFGGCSLHGFIPGGSMTRAARREASKLTCVCKEVRL
jgi:hypothetical protein